MKKNIIAAVIAATFIVACSDNDNSLAEAEIQGFDGPVQFADVTYDCGSERGNLGQTDYNGNVLTSSSYSLSYTPELCEIIITGNSDSIDTSNGKAMPDIRYVIPKGLLSAGQPITGSPLTTLIDAQIKSGTIGTIEEITAQVITDLYGEDFVNNNSGLDPLSLARDMEAVIATLGDDDASLVTATNHVANDIIIFAADAEEELNIASVLTTTQAIAADVITNKPNYPTTNSGEEIYISVNEDAAKIVYDNVEFGSDDPTNGVEDIVTPEPSDPPPPPATGATGAS